MVVYIGVGSIIALLIMIVVVVTVIMLPRLRAHRKTSQSSHTYPLTSISGFSPANSDGGDDESEDDNMTAVFNHHHHSNSSVSVVNYPNKSTLKRQNSDHKPRSFTTYQHDLYS